MEAFSLLKYWIGGGGGAAATGNMRPSATTTITATVPRPAPETDDSDDEGPFFDLEFTLPVEEGGFGEEGSSNVEAEDRELLDFTVSSGSGRTHRDLLFSPSDNLFFKGGLMSLEPSSVVFNSGEINSKRQFPVSLLRSATKFRVFLLGFKKAKPTAETNGTAAEASSPKQQQQHSRFFTVKFKVEEVPIVSLFRRENSCRSSSNCKMHLDDAASDDGGISSSEMKRLAKEAMHKYLKIIKPLYVRVSKRNVEKPRFSGQLSLLGFGLGGKPRKRRSCSSSSSSSNVPAPELSRSNSSSDHKLKKQQRQGSLKGVCRHLSKSRSVLSSSASMAATAVAAPHLQSQRQDDSLLQQQDGIQSAITHCKRSFNTPLESEEVVSIC